MKLNFQIVLSFDLDFTLIDNREGIINSFNYALQKYNLPQSGTEDIVKMIGVPLDEMFSKVTDFDSSLLCSAFREYYSSEGIFQVKLFPRVRDLLKKLKKSFVLGIITSKKEELAIKLLKDLKIASNFDFILGEIETRKGKTHPDLIQFLLEKYFNYQFVIIGDHLKDKKLAEKLGCPFVGVLTGNHSENDLKSNMNNVKTMILKSVQEITIDKIYSLF
ncbi:MAG: HAD family hydrolase [Promethearchaeota archaeon]|nr:MAG: HAD family hydrolase [Candidatus Lokiarchaeota archaeon]